MLTAQEALGDSKPATGDLSEWWEGRGPRLRAHKQACCPLELSS